MSNYTIITRDDDGLVRDIAHVDAMGDDEAVRMVFSLFTGCGNAEVWDGPVLVKVLSQDAHQTQ